jgi:hypothetical protein
MRKIFFHLSQLYIPDEHGISRRHRYDEPCKTVQKPKLEKVDLQELKRRSRQKQSKPVTLSLRIQILRQQAGKTIHSGKLAGNNPLIGVMKEIIFQFSNASLHLYPFVDTPPDPMSLLSSKEPELLVGIKPAVINPSALVKGTAGDPVSFF